MISEWALSIDEAYIVDWANKGLYRRGTKTLEKQDIETWSFSMNRVSACIDEYEQSVESGGLDGLLCSCPATVTCHHLVCFLLGIKSHYEKTHSKASPVSSAEESDDAGVQLAPWVIVDRSERQKTLGKPQLDRALRWLALQLEIEVEINKHSLRASVYEGEVYRVTVPHAGGLSAAICSCKKVKCVHLAYLVVHQTKAWCHDNDQIDAFDSTLLVDQTMRAALTALEEWLMHILLQGLGSISVAHGALGEAIVTDLRQSDLPRIASQVSSLLILFKKEKQSTTLSDLNDFRVALAGLYASLKALAKDQPSQALVKLAGQHRRTFFIRPQLTLCCISSNIWRSDSGFDGYTVYFYCPEDQHVYWLSESRSRSYDTNWSPQQALSQRTIDGHKLLGLVGQTFVMHNAKLSFDRKLNADAAVELEGVCKLSNLELVEMVGSSNEIDNWLDQQAENPYSSTSNLHLITISDVKKTTYLRFKNHWECAAQAHGHQVRIVIETKRHMSCIERHRSEVVAMLGNLSIRDSEIFWSPLAILTAAQTIILP